MKRRSFILKSGLGLSSIGFTSKLTACTTASQKHTDQRQLLPKKLSEGDTVGLITPGSPLSNEAYQKVFKNMEALKLKVKTSANFNKKQGFIAGSDEERISDIHSMFSDQSVKAIICGRGGYGTGRLLDQLDYELIRKNPKIIIGFSDITALLNAIYINTGMTCFHGPVAASEFSPFTTSSFQDTLMKGSNNLSYRNQELFSSNDPSYKSLVISKGSAEGPLMGGNLSILASLLGTPYFPSLQGKILFIEEIGEYPYRIDRMFTQLLNAKVLDGLAGIALGIFYNCKDTGESKTSKALEVIKERLSGLDIPILYGLPFGHVDHNATLPLGINARLDTTSASLTILEPSVS